MKDYDITCGDTQCEIHVRSHPTADGGSVYLATPYVVDGRTLVPVIVSNSNAHLVDVASSSEESALERAVEVLERRFGARVAPPVTPSTSVGVREIKPPRDFPRRDQ